jgi:arsenate reductase
MLKFYQLEKCGTCRKAVLLLKAKGIPYESVAIREHPPTRVELKRMLKIVGGDLRRLFNTSGLEYKRLNMKDRLPTLKEDEAIELLASNGSLVKRPFVLYHDRGLVGFKPDEWEKLLGK